MIILKHITVILRLYMIPGSVTYGQGCESSFLNGTNFSSSSKKAVELLELSLLSSVPLYKNFRKTGTKFSSSSKKMGGTAGT